MRVLVTGVTGYIGGRLVPRLLERGHRVRVLVRDARRIRGRAWADRVEVFEGDLQVRTPQLEAAFADLDAAYYLVHSMYAGSDFARRDRVAAQNFVDLGRDLPLVVYLGGILPGDQEVSEHLGSRAEVGEILRAHLPTTEFRAGPILGSGSASFEMVRYLTERIPVMVTPRWIRNQVRPIGVRDILTYLLAALEKPPLGTVHVGTDPLTFGQMMEGYARVRGFRRHIIPLPWLVPRLAALWVGLVTPIPNRLAVPLVEGVVHPVVGNTDRARELFPEIRPMAYEAAVELALQRIHEGAIETRWSGALTDGPTYEFRDREGLMEEVRTCHVRATPARVYEAFTSLGGERGWLVWNWAWWLRGALDRMLGGPGLRRGRRHPTELLPGEAVDFWRVEALEPGRLMRLRAEMKVPGRAWLQFEGVPEGEGTRLVQAAMFAPRGLAGVLYWYSLYPAHRFIFSAMLAAVARLAEAPPRPGPG